MKAKNKIAASNSGTVKTEPNNERKTCVFCQAIVYAEKMDELIIRRKCLTRFCEGRRITISANSDRNDCREFGVCIYGESPESLKQNYRSFIEFCDACLITVYVLSSMVSRIA